jgi:hypothetical protein
VAQRGLRHCRLANENSLRRTLLVYFLAQNWFEQTIARFGVYKRKNPARGFGPGRETKWSFVGRRAALSLPCQHTPDTGQIVRNDS